MENDSVFTHSYPDVPNYIGETGFGLDGSGVYFYQSVVENIIETKKMLYLK